jgi:hypothetical protein
MSKCTDCKEYNKEKHYCPKFCDVIRNTTKEMQEFYKGEHDKLEKIEQIINGSDDFIKRDADYRIAEIKEVLESEDEYE